ncbi:hypothetical protein SRHO_G00302790 [Serrasalmus rhombeus]
MATGVAWRVARLRVRSVPLLFSLSHCRHGLCEHQHRVFWADEYIPEGVRNWACQNTGGLSLRARIRVCLSVGVPEYRSW